MGIYDAPKFQVVTVILGLVAMSVGMVIVVFHGPPTKPFEEGEYHALFDLGAYLCPLLAAVCAGAGLFLHFPRIGAGTWVALQQRSPKEAKPLRTKTSRPITLPHSFSCCVDCCATRSVTRASRRTSLSSRVRTWSPVRLCFGLALPSFQTMRNTAGLTCAR